MDISALIKAIEASDGPASLEELVALTKSNTGNQEQDDTKATELSLAEHKVDENGNTLFHLVAHCMPENTEVIKALTEVGVDPSKRASDGESGFDALMAANPEKGAGILREVVLKPILEIGNYDRLQELAMSGFALKYCVPPSQEMDKAFTSVPEDIVIKITDILDAQSKQESVATQIRNNGSLEASQITELGSLAKGQTRDGLTLLHHAVVYRNAEALKSILAALPGATAVLDHMKRTPLHYAAVSAELSDIFNILKDAGADDSIVDANGKTPLDYSATPTLLSLEDVKKQSEKLLQAREVSQETSAKDDSSEEAKAVQLSDQVGSKESDTVDSAQDQNAQTEQSPKEEEEKAPEQAGPRRIKPMDMYVSRRGQQRKDPATPAPHTAEGRYIAQHLGSALTAALAEIAEVRPWDPIEYLARWLYKYRKDEAYTRKQAELLQTIRDEEARLAKEEELKFKRIEELRRYQEEEAEKKRIEEEERKKKEQEELLRSAKESNLVQKPALPTVSEEGEEGALQEDEDDDGELDDDTLVKDRDRTGKTELHKLAAQQGVDVTALIQLGYSIADKDINGKTARDIAHDAGQTETVAALDKYLRRIMEDGREDVLEKLVLEGYDGLDGVNKAGLPQVTLDCIDRLSALREQIASTMKSAASRETEAIAEVKEAVDTQPLLVRAQDEAGRSLLHIAVLAESQELITHLITSFPDTAKARDNLNRTALHYAWGTSPELAELLISKGANSKARDAMKRKPVYYKAKNADIKAIQESLGLTKSVVPSVTIAEPEQVANPSMEDEREEEKGQVATVVGATE